MSSDPLIGMVLHDTHEVLRLIGKGGMGSVYEARHVHLNKSFAVKVLDPRFAENDTVFARFKREALISSSLGHAAIVQVSDFYLHDDGRPCMVMEYLEGQDLGEVLKKRKKLPPEELVSIVEQVAGALQAVHDQGIVHRDMKPGNIFLAEQKDGSTQAKVLDFGISKIKNPEDGVETLTTSHTILGTPHFMSPEQALGEVGDVDWRTDIFALGTISYYALSGKLPFNAPSLHGVLVKIETREPPPITGLVPGLTEVANLAIQKAMAKDKADRYDRAEQFAANLKAGLAAPRTDGQEEENEAEEAAFTTLMDVNARPSGEEKPEPEGAPAVASEPASPPRQPAEDPNMTNVLPLDELLKEVGGEKEEEGEEAEEAQAAVGDEVRSPGPEEVPADEEPVESPIGEKTEHLEVEDMEEVLPADEEAAAPAPSIEGEDFPAAAPAPKVQEPAASSTVVGTPETAEDKKDEEVASLVVDEGPPGVSPHTTLSGAAGEQSTLKVAPTPGGKPVAAKALAAAAVLLLALGGVYLAARTPGDPGSASQDPETSVAAASRPEPAPVPEKQAPPAKPAQGQAKVAEPEPTPAPVEKKVSVTLQITPRTARVFLDGRARTENPLPLPQSNRQHRLRVEATGYKTHQQDLLASADMTIKVALSKAKPAVATKPRRVRGPSTAIKPPAWVDPFDKKPRPTAKKKSREDDGFSTLTVPAPKPKPKPKKKASEEAFDSL